MELSTLQFDLAAPLRAYVRTQRERERERHVEGSNVIRKKKARKKAQKSVANIKQMRMFF